MCFVWLLSFGLISSPLGEITIDCLVCYTYFNLCFSRGIYDGSKTRLSDRVQF